MSATPLMQSAVNPQNSENAVLNNVTAKANTSATSSFTSFGRTSFVGKLAAGGYYLSSPDGNKAGVNLATQAFSVISAASGQVQAQTLELGSPRNTYIIPGLTR